MFGCRDQWNGQQITVTAARRLFTACRRSMTLSSRQLDKAAFDLLKQCRRQRTEVAGLGLDRPYIWPWPDKSVAFRQNNPGSLVVQSEAPFRCWRDLDRVSWIRGRRMRDRQNPHGRRSIFQGCSDRQHECRAILVTLLPAFEMLPMPKIRISEEPADLWFSRQHAFPSTVRH